MGYFKCCNWGERDVGREDGVRGRRDKRGVGELAWVAALSWRLGGLLSYTSCSSRLVR